MQFERSSSVLLNGLRHQRLQELLRIACVCLLTPFIFITLNFLYIYRCLVEIILRIQFKGKFAGFLKGTDCVWAIEDAVSLSVINILMILEKSARDSNAIFLENFKNLVNDRIVSKAAGTTFEKLLYRRSQKYGYYFWERNEDIDLKNRIGWLECKNADCDSSCEDVSSESFRKNLGNICNKPLPDDHTAAWEILIGKRCPRSRSRVEEGRLSPEECFDTDACKIPIIFRVHHSLGDGIALLGLLLEAIADKNETKVSKTKNIVSINANETNCKEYFSSLHNSEKNLSNEMKNQEIVQSYEKNILAASMPFTYMRLPRILKDLQDHFHVLLKCSKSITIDFIKQQAKISINHMWLNFKDIFLKQVYENIKQIAQLMTIILSAPKYLAQQAVRSMDENSLHGPPQTGEKIVSYWLENDVDKSQKLLMKVRKIRKSTGAKFGDIILAAFSASVHKYHLRINKPVPDSLTAILPIRMTMVNENMTLDNNFSIALLRICISNANGLMISEPNQDSQFFNRLQDIMKANNELKNNPDILLNFWIMKYIFAILPVKILKALFLSRSTMVFSNMYGPQRVRILNNSLSNIAFWVPNKSTTALGFSLLSYGDNLHLSLMADKSIINDEKSFTEILEDTVHEINHAYNRIILTHILKLSDLPVETPMETGIGVF
ncbi:uncharacterized protein LOC114934948 isoform X2 [Nylanderia fulva]|uniref:uncharacterized protein LOC114934948 isoform X2 n=1 Tax=Nylanderia fulva TaxID=613905 RepID=UPI0010FB6CAC|nr:uncharacterized protein LOC114934948 isoform X2 [Nylanderia fulva]